MTADFVINEVHYSKDPKHIEKVKTRYGTEFSRQEVVNLLKNGKKIETSLGAEVSIVKVKGNDFIRTDKDNTEKDNLGKLPEY